MDIKDDNINVDNKTEDPALVKTKNSDGTEDIDDIKFESYNDDTDGGTKTPEDRIKLLRQKLKESDKAKIEYLDGWQRLKADFVNFKKREDEGKEMFMKFARESLVVDLLPVLESFHMAFVNKEAWEKVDPAWRKGVEYIHTQLTQTLENQGLQKVDPALGSAFDPNEHTSIGTIANEDTAKQHTIAEVVQLGYRLNGKLVKSPTVKLYAEAASATKDEKGE